MAKRTWTDANWDDSVGVEDGGTMGLPTPEVCYILDKLVRGIRAGLMCVVVAELLEARGPDNRAQAPDPGLGQRPSSHRHTLAAYIEKNNSLC
jgi:hypothetical protein